MLPQKDLVSLRGLSKDEILFILDTASEMKRKIDNPSERDNSLQSVSVATLFYENSTRTKMSFLMAGSYLGATIHDLGVSTSSAQKGERLVETGENLDQMGIGIMIIRHQQTGAPHLLAKRVKASVINAGDGTNEHPTQALLDLMTIRERYDDFKGLKVVILGDISHSRVARSNAFGLTTLGASVTLAGPATLVSANMQALGVSVTNNISRAVAGADVVMGLRIQFERDKAAAFPTLREYSDLFGITEEVLEAAKPRALVMHPGPINRGVELSVDVIDGKRSVIYQQVKNGVAVRMALLKILSDKRLL